MNESALSLRKGLKGWHSVAEEVMIARDIELARAFGGKIHICHVSTARGVELIRRAKADGILVTCEVTPHHLVLTEEAVGDYDTHAKMSPPLRAQTDLDALIAGLRDGTVDAVASDHAPHDPDSKNVEFGKAAFGILGLQTTMPLMMELVREGKIPLSRAIGAVSSGPAKCFGLAGGTLAVGAAADLVIFDAERAWTFGGETSRSKSVNSPFWGKKMTGQAETVIVGGNVVVSGGQLISERAAK
jgi:dihydroorotase